MDDRVVGALTQLGGVATTSAVRAATSRRQVRAAVRRGVVVRPRVGMLALPVVSETDLVVARTGGARSHLSAALHHGWPVLLPPERPVITLPAHGSICAARRDGAQVFWAPLTADERAGGVTAPLRTVLDCARRLPYADALAVADSALRAGAVSRAELVAASLGAPRTGRAAAVRVAEAADPRAANPFESALRACCHEVPGLAVEPQVLIADAEGNVIGRVDLAEVASGLVIEGESWEFHGNRKKFADDVRRYTALVRAGWTVVRFMWEDVVHRPHLVTTTLADVVNGPPARMFRHTVA